jgi:predicted glycoside hydrolase/deacetylase ChbG (UPF0249 family)
VLRDVQDRQPVLTLLGHTRKVAVRYLIVNGDDFGLTSGVTRGILDAHGRGILTSTSLMVNRPAAVEAAAAARGAPELSVGIHLESEGDGVDVRAALDRQLRRFERLMGRAPTHLDSHRDWHCEPRVLPAVLGLAERLGVPLRGHSAVSRLGKFYGHWGGEDHPEQVGAESLLGMLETETRPGVTELICHPGYVDPGLESSYRAVREIEVETLCDPRVREALERDGIRLIGFRELPAVLRGAAASER